MYALNEDNEKVRNAVCPSSIITRGFIRGIGKIFGRTIGKLVVNLTNFLDLSPSHRITHNRIDKSILSITSPILFGTIVRSATTTYSRYCYSFSPTVVLALHRSDAHPRKQQRMMSSLRYTVGIALFLGGVSRFQAFQQVPMNGRSSSSSLGAVSKKDSYTITLLPGDGIGPEITAATRGVLSSLCEKCGFSLVLKEALIGGAAIDAKNDPFPQESLDQCLSSDSVLLACIGGYKWDNNPRELRPESGLLKMRKEMGLFANLRPAKVLSQLVDASTLKREVVEGVDVMVVRELTGDVYFGTPKGIDVVDGE